MERVLSDMVDPRAYNLELNMLCETSNGLGL